MYCFIAFLAGAIAGGIVMFFVGKKHGQRAGELAARLKDTLGKA